MSYINTVNPQLLNYFSLLSKEYPTFIDEYINLFPLQRLKKVGQFCGCDYSPFYTIKYWYSRLDHSVACALMTYHFTKDKEQTLAALFHDLGTPSFSHVVDFLHGDSQNQSCSEKNVRTVILESKELLQKLEEDHILVDAVCDYKRYPIVGNKAPKMYIDHLEGIFHTALVWLHFWDLDRVSLIYNNLTVLENEDHEPEIGFMSRELAESCYEGIHQYGMSMQADESKYVLQAVAGILEMAIQEELITMEDLYIMSEQAIIHKIEESDSVAHTLWIKFVSTCHTKDIDIELPKKVKKRYVVPLCQTEDGPVRLHEISDTCKALLHTFLDCSDSAK